MKNLKAFLIATAISGIVGYAFSQDPDPLTVTNILDDGIGSLRYAITYSNSNPGTDKIVFNIPGSGPFEVLPIEDLPTITDPVIIDGYSQPGSKPATTTEPAKIMIKIRGILYGNLKAGLTVNAGNSNISGLEFRVFQQNLILQENGNNKIHGCVFTLCFHNILIYSSDNQIGGITPAERNIIIFAEAGNGIFIDNSGGNAARNKITGNYIGIDETGSGFGNNDFCGVAIKDSPDNIIGGKTAAERNIISNNTTGISIGGSNATGNRIEGNFIRGNSQSSGVYINSPGNFIGGSAEGAGNLISGNFPYGIVLGPSATGNIIQGNLIGTDYTGHLKAGNFAFGILIEGGKNNRIGGKNAGEINVISGNGEDGISINGITLPGGTIEWAEGNIIEGNYIGTDISGQAALGNTNHGIYISSYANSNLIGGNEPASGNLIAFNGLSGVAIEGGPNAGRRNSILSNSIHSNTVLGIDLGNDKYPSQNDPGDTDSGPNNMQNTPVLTSLRFSLGFVDIDGVLNSMPDKEFRIQFFANKGGDDSGFGEGQTYLGEVNVTTNSSGNASFSESFQIKKTDGQLITATATDADGNTSEFSEIIFDLVENIPAKSKIFNIYPNPASGSVTITFEISEGDLGSGNASVRIYDISGKLVHNLIKGNISPGYYSVTWSGNSVRDTKVPAGIYLIRLKAGKVEQVRQVMMIR